MAQLALFNEGVRDHFPICGNFCEVLLVAGGFILFSLHGMVWDLARGAGIPAPRDAIDVCVSKHQSALIGGDRDSQLHRSVLRKQEKRRALSDKRSVLLTAGGVRFWSKEQSDVARNRAMDGQEGY